MDEADDRNVDSILCVGDDSGNIHCFLDGSFPLGSFQFNTSNPTVSISKDSKEPIFFAHLSTSAGATDVPPAIVRLPLLRRRIVRDVARTSTSARELAWYVLRSVKEMRTTWYGSESQSGAREMGTKWVAALELKQKNQFGRTSLLCSQVDRHQ